MGIISGDCIVGMLHALRGRGEGGRREENISQECAKEKTAAAAAAAERSEAKSRVESGETEIMWRWERVKCEVMRPESGCSCVMSNRTHTGERAHTLSTVPAVGTPE